jgi:hypothetical protein
MSANYQCQGELDPKSEELLALLDGPFKVLRDDTLPDPDRLLVYDPKAAPVIQALSFEQVTTRYKCGGVGSRWSPECLAEIKKVKRECLQETLDSCWRRDQGDESEYLPCGTPCLVVRGRNFPHAWVVVKAHID